MPKRSASARRSAPRPRRATNSAQPNPGRETSRSGARVAVFRVQLQISSFLLQEGKVAEAEREREAQRAAAQTGDKQRTTLLEHQILQNQRLLTPQDQTQEEKLLGAEREREAQRAAAQKGGGGANPFVYLHPKTLNVPLFTSRLNPQPQVS